MFINKRKAARSFLSALFFLILLVKTEAQNSVVLPGNNNISREIAPQGAARYQRQFYLITDAEMKAAGWSSGAAINAIGFRLAVAQNDTTRGKFKVYLQNTTNTQSRLDTAWTSVSVTGNRYKATGLSAGKYEWQVIPVCTNAAFDTASSTFSSKDLGTCPQPTALSTRDITATSAQFQWTSPASAVSRYFVMYSRIDSIDWKLDSTTTSTYSANSLTPGKLYQWKVWPKCGNDTAAAVSTSFTTETIVSCATAPSGLTNGTGTGTSKILSWTEVAGATRYDIQYRRQGSVQWSSLIAFGDSITISQALVAGTVYEWRIRTVCVAGSGAYVYGTPFTTTGTAVCYAPALLSADSVTATSVSFSWSGLVTGTYTLRYRLRETISWTNAIAPMTLVSNDVLLIPKTTGAYMHNFSGGSAFVYSGGGLYIAFEHSRDAGNLTSFNTAFARVEANVTKSTATLLDTSATAPGNTLNVTPFRPETLLGSSALKDSVEVSAVYALGQYASGYSDGATVSARIVNHAQISQTLTVTFNVKDTASISKYTATKTITVAARSSDLVVFTGWNPTQVATDSLIISVPVQTGETLTGNNRNYYIQKVNPYATGYDNGTQNISGGGFGGGSGLILAKYRMNGCGAVTGSRIYLAPGAKGKSLYAVIMDSTGKILSQSAAFTADSTTINNYHHFYFPAAQSFTNAHYYVGLAQSTSGSYFPVGIQWDTETPRTGAYFKAPLAGGLPTDTSFGGRLMINAEVTAGRAVAEINGNTILCPNGSTTLTAGTVNARFANKVLGFSSQNGTLQYSADMALGTPDVFPSHAPAGSAWVSQTADGQREFLELQFGSAAPINFIDIYETFNPGSIDSVFVKNPSTNQFELVFSGAASNKQVNVSNKKRISFPLTAFAVSEVRIALGSNITTGFNAIDAVSIGTVTSPATSGTFSWSTNSTANAITVNSPGSYTLTINDPEACSSSNTVQVSSRTAVKPAIIFQNSAPAKDTAICAGESLILKARPGTGLVWSTGGTNDTIVVRQSGKYTVSYNDGSGCGSVVSDTIVVSINALPTVAISGTLGICPGGTTVLDAGAGYSSYAWSTGASTRTVTVFTPGVYRVTVKNSTGCAASSSVTTFAATNPVPAITGALQFCSGSSTVLDAGSGYSQYTWSTGATTQTLTVTTPGTYSVTVKNDFGCSGTASAQATNFTPPVPAVSGARAFCPGGSTILTAETGYNSYTWSNGATTRSITVSAVGNYTVSVTDNNGCSGSSTIGVTQLTAPVPNITGGSTLCGGSSGTLNAGPGYSSYLWSTGATTQNLTVINTGTYSVSVTDAQGCSGSASISITQEGNPPQTPGVISGPVSGLCNTTGKIYSIAPVSGATYYVWTVPEGATITAGDRTTSITVSFGPTLSSGSIVVAAANSCGQSSSINPRTLSLQAIPATPGAISGPTTGVCGPTSRTYAVGSVSAASSYTWTVPAGATITSGQGTTSVVVSFASGYVAGNICVKANSACGSSSNSCLAVAGIPPTPGPISGIISVCSKQKNVQYSVQPVPGATSYTWTVPTQATITSGQGTNSIMVTFGTKTGNVTVKTTGTCGTSGTQSLAVNMNCTGASTSASFSSGLKSISAATEMIAYPNPSNGVVKLTMPDDLDLQQYEVKVFDAHGKIVFAKMLRPDANILTVDLRQVTKGLYLINVSGGRKNKSVRVILH